MLTNIAQKGSLALINQDICIFVTKKKTTHTQLTPNSQQQQKSQTQGFDHGVKKLYNLRNYDPNLV